MGVDQPALAEEPRVSRVATPGRTPFLAFLADEESEAAVRGGLLALGDALQLRRGNVVTATKALEREATPAILLVDVSGVEDSFAALDDLARVCTPDVRVLVVGQVADLAFYRRLTRDLGVAEYLDKPLTRDSVARLFGPHVVGHGGGEEGERGGRIVSILGARGGCGATTVAVNLALHLAEVSRGHVALLDLHLRGGTTALLLGARAGTGLRVALEEPERVDALFLDRSSVAVADRVRLIAAEEPMDSDPRPTEAGVRSLLSLLTARFNLVVVDVPSPPGPAERVALAASRHRVIVLPPEVGGIRDALALRKAVGGLGAGQVLTLLNRAGVPGGLRNALVAEGLGGPPDGVIPDLPRAVPRAANLGRPALTGSAALRRALAPLTQEVAGVRAAAPGGSGLGRFFRRGGG